MPVINIKAPGAPGAYSPYGGALEAMKCREHQFFLFGSAGCGKSLANDQPVLTPFGWKPIGEIHVGDEVISVDGSRTKVTGVFPQGVLPTYEVKCKDGASVKVSADHLWVTHSRNGKGIGLDAFTVKTTAQIAETILERHYIPIADPADLIKQDLPIEPYILGVLLGDGTLTKRGTIFNSEDPEIVERVKTELPEDYKVYTAPKTDRCQTYTIVRVNEDVLPMSEILRSIGAYGKTALEKAIPALYLSSCVEDRVALLQGLMDTDGSIVRGGAVCFHTSSKTLAEGVIELARSLGGTSTLRSKIPTSLYNGERKTGKLSYTCQLTLPNEIVPFFLSRKLDRRKLRTKYFPSREIESVTPVEEAECTCISVAHPSKLFITKDYIVTHNTTSLCWKMHLLCLLYPGCKFLFTRKSYKSLIKSGVETYERIVRESGMEFGRKSDQIRKMGESQPTEFVYPYGKRKDETGREYEGQSRIVLASLDRVYDEMGAEYDYIYVNQPEQITEQDWQFLATRANGRRGKAPYPQLFGDPNPEHERHWIKVGGYELIDGEQVGDGDRWRLIKSTYRDNPVIWDQRENKFTENGEQQIGRLMKSLNSVMTKRLIDGEWASFEGLVYGDTWKRGEHLLTRESFEREHGEITDAWPRFIAIDFGYVDPFVCQWWAKHPHHELYVCYRYICMSGRTIPEHAQTIRNHMIGEPRPQLVIADRNPENIAVLSEELGINVVSVKKFSGSIKAGINIIADMLQNKELFFLEDACVETDTHLVSLRKPIGFENEVENYRWTVDKKDAEEVIGGDDHCLDATRYLMAHLKANQKTVKVLWI